MYVKVKDTKSGQEFYYFIPDAPARLVLTEETQRYPCRNVYSVSRAPFTGAREMPFSDFANILFFDLAFDSISDELWNWVNSVVS